MPRPVSLAVALAATGCAASSRSGVVIAHPPGAASETRPAPSAATYALHAAGPDAADGPPIHTIPVDNGRQIGFVRAADGSLAGYAAGRRFPVPEGAYVWRVVPHTRRPPTGVVYADDPDPPMFPARRHAADVLAAMADGFPRFLGQAAWAFARMGGGGR